MNTLLLLGVVALLGYVVACALWPYATCSQCGGSGKRRSPSGRSWRLCRRCKGSGRRVRLGRRLWNFVSDVRD